MDRNFDTLELEVLYTVSLSARRAWIEIIHIYGGAQKNGSLSARRAWIEIVHPACQGAALRGRSPQGERG